ncbi:response regulator [Bdellovibrio sp. qaytius]|nr:response regulator [Bdellovibrio sp. qaytius]
MALRVLLADESSTIKKVLQLALSDFGIEVKSVPSGIDVISVALDYRPDIIFADVLLTKRNGYEVCGDIKANPQLRNIPVVLMWSSFMEFDEKLAQKMNANGRLEKPFDTEALRSVVNKLVKKTETHPLKGLLDFPTLPDFEESETMVRHRLQNQAENDSLVIDDDPEDFEPLDLKPVMQQRSPSHLSSMNRPAAHQPVPAKPQKQTVQTITEEYDPMDDIQIETENFGEFEEVVLVKGEKEEALETKIQGQLKSYLESSPVALNKIQNSNDGSKGKPSSRFDEQLMREEVRSMAEKICWQIIPEITEKIVREELKKLLTDIEKSV